MPEVLIDRNAGAGDRAALPTFYCARRTDGLGANWVQADGELDLASSPQLRRKLEEVEGAGGLAGQYGSPRQVPAGAAA